MRKNLYYVIAILLMSFFIAMGFGCQKKAPSAPDATVTKAPASTPATDIKKTESTETPQATESSDVPPAPPRPKVGDNVAAPLNGAYYLGAVQSISGERVDVLFTKDKQVRTLDQYKVKVIQKKDWRVGDKMMAVKPDGRFYYGKIAEVKGDGTYVINWDDGSEPSTVDASKIMYRENPPAVSSENDTKGAIPGKGQGQ